MSETPQTDVVGQPEADLEPVPAGSLVVGHDGSDGADYALAQALELAEELAAPLVIVRAWSIASAPRPPTWEFGYVSSFDEYAAAVHAALVGDAGRLVDRHPSVSVDYRAVHADPATALIDLSREARMLVVGSRGLGGFRGLVLGSVSERCMRHADCPVLVARPRHHAE